ncbi:hypothetical protein BJ165DRAFT_1518448 [Panaeolus papilionaceus]|nr:hypothetical protein BJ165DRAFT_1518448 [Panaeolus papilionaceus]
MGEFLDLPAVMRNYRGRLRVVWEATRPHPTAVARQARPSSTTDGYEPSLVRPHLNIGLTRSREIL